MERVKTSPRDRWREKTEGERRARSTSEQGRTNTPHARASRKARIEGGGCSAPAERVRRVRLGATSSCVLRASRSSLPSPYIFNPGDRVVEIAEQVVKVRHRRHRRVRTQMAGEKERGKDCVEKGRNGGGRGRKNAEREGRSVGREGGERKGERKGERRERGREGEREGEREGRESRTAPASKKKHARKKRSAL